MGRPCSGLMYMTSDAIGPGLAAACCGPAELLKEPVAAALAELVTRAGAEHNRVYVAAGHARAYRIRRTTVAWFLAVAP